MAYLEERTEGLMLLADMSATAADVERTLTLPTSPQLILLGETRAKLAQVGLIGKIFFTSDWSEVQLREEMTAIFRRTFALSMGQSFPFEYLSTIKGCKRLMKPNISSSFLWGGKEVGSISSTTCLYIMALMHKPVQEEPEELSDSDFESPVCWRRRVHVMSPSTSESELYHQETEGISQWSENDKTARKSIASKEKLVKTLVYIMFLWAVCPVYLEEDEALEEAIQRSLLEESDGSSAVHILKYQMAKSNAERQREYRARRNAQKREEYLRKECEWWKRDTEAGKKKSINDLSKRAQRHKWKEWRKAKERQKRKAEIDNSGPISLTPPHSPDSEIQDAVQARPESSRNQRTHCAPNSENHPFASDEHDAEEDAADPGGPRQEFFHLLVKAIFQDSGAFEGTPNACTPRFNILHLQNGVYRIIGRMMSTIIVQGGEPPAFLSPHVVDYIVSGDILQVHGIPDDIGYPELRENLKKVMCNILS
ncbi:hypothetical protein ABVT39_021118 [Epinephelus coioides]